MTTLLSYGLGVDSTAILLNWLENPSSRKYTIRRIVGDSIPPKFKKVGEGKVDLRDLTVLTAMTGDEFPDLKHLVETHVLPRLRQHGIRYVQVARASMKEKLSVLDDSTAPYTLHLNGDFKLSDELLLNATVPQYRSGSRRCSLKYKGDPLDTWISALVGDEPFAQAFGFDANEKKRVITDLSYSREKWGKNQKTSIYPLFDWEWDRQTCIDFIRSITGMDWPKSACSYCPFTMGEDPVMQRFAQYPEEAAKSLFIEYVSMALNYRQSLYPEEATLLAAVQALGQADALSRFGEMLDTSQWALYWVRRIYVAKTQAYRSVRILEEGSRQEMQADRLPGYGQVSLEGGIPRVITIPRAEGVYPTLEEVIVAAPRTVENKDRFKDYDARWASAVQGDWSFLHEKYRPQEDDEEEGGESEEAELRGRSRSGDVKILAVDEDDSRRDEKKWLCKMSDVIKTPYIPQCPAE
jgi:hypothetical protein